MPALPVSCLRAVLLLVAWMLHVSAEAGSTGYKASFSQRGMVASTKTLTLLEAVAPALGALRHGLTSERISAERAHHDALKARALLTAPRAQTPTTSPAGHIPC